MNFESIVALAASRGASDLHLETGLQATLRIRGQLQPVGEKLTNGLVRGMVRQVLGDQAWGDFQKRRSADVSETIAGVRCRINAMHSLRGLGLAVRLLPAILPTVKSLNLHDELIQLAYKPHGLILVSGPTGCGKSSTLTALLQEINLAESRHIVTIEQPIEYYLKPEKSFIRQREVGRDTPSFEQALMDAMRQDPDVIMIGEMREPECMRLTLNAAETGHLVLATVHSSSVAEALQRMVLAFPAEIQTGISSQLADCLLAVICQRLTYREDIDLRVPECEILIGTSASRALIRKGEFFKLGSVLETGGNDGMYSWDRYRKWLSEKTNWQHPSQPLAAESGDIPPTPPHRRAPAQAAAARPAKKKSSPDGKGVLEIEPPKGDLAAIVAELEKSDEEH
ncbi:MAG: PilT/PilU family type 4a pilus ATPase [Deltaproteobacteria bacterium]|nr:PilT/PilU family type 4a pilus ATPase [Deltaproteobacteria bacterium]